MKLRIIPFLLLFLLSGCGAQDLQSSLQFARLGTNTTEILQTWEGNRTALEKYRDMLEAGDPDRATVQDLIDTGELVRMDLEAITGSGWVPTLFELRMLFVEADEAVQVGVDLYRKYEDRILRPDKYRARMFSQTWNEIRTDLEALDRTTSKSERYAMAKEILSFVLMVTGQVVIPSLQVAGKI